MSAENGLKIRVGDAEGRVLMCVEGALRLPNTAELQQALVAALPEGESKPLVLDVSGATDLDLSGMQLLCSAHRTLLDSPVLRPRSSR